MNDLHKTLNLEGFRGHVWVVGDIHGMYPTLMRKLAQRGFNQNTDILLSVGDLIDRGEDSYKCLKLIQQPWFHAVRGNHEQMMYDTIRNPSFDVGIWYMNGGAWFETCESRQEIVDNLDHIMSMLPISLTVKLSDGRRIGLIHAEPPSDWENRKQFSEERALWSRNLIKIVQRGDINRKVDNIDHVYCGHTITDVPVHSGNISWVDTGAYYHGNITVIKII